MIVPSVHGRVRGGMSAINARKCAYIILHTQRNILQHARRNPLSLSLASPPIWLPTAKFPARYGRCCWLPCEQLLLLLLLVATVIYTQFSNSVNRYFAYACASVCTSPQSILYCSAESHKRSLSLSRWRIHRNTCTLYAYPNLNAIYYTRLATTIGVIAGLACVLCSCCCCCCMAQRLRRRTHSFNRALRIWGVCISIVGHRICWLLPKSDGGWVGAERDGDGGATIAFCATSNARAESAHAPHPKAPPLCASPPTSNFRNRQCGQCNWVPPLLSGTMWLPPPPPPSPSTTARLIFRTVSTSGRLTSGSIAHCGCCERALYIESDDIIERLFSSAIRDKIRAGCAN